MKCQKCGKNYTSKLSFVTESICQSCFNEMSDQEKMKLLDAKDEEKKEKTEELLIRRNKIKCSVCGNAKFWKYTVSNNSPEASIFGFDAINHQIENYTCSSCGYMMRFLREKK